MSDDGLQVAVEWERTRLAGSVWRPAAKPRSLILMHPASGPSDRNNDVYFPPIRQALLAAGHAIASFDKRKVGGSSGDWTAAGIETQAADLFACASALQERVVGVPIGVFGHSQVRAVPAMFWFRDPDGNELLMVQSGGEPSNPPVREP
jgi:alpha-beta hydrolase superfamily lysophospholipase